MCCVRVQERKNRGERGGERGGERRERRREEEEREEPEVIKLFNRRNNKIIQNICQKMIPQISDTSKSPKSSKPTKKIQHMIIF